MAQLSSSLAADCTIKGLAPCLFDPECEGEWPGGEFERTVHLLACWSRFQLVESKDLYEWTSLGKLPQCILQTRHRAATLHRFRMNGFKVMEGALDGVQFPEIYCSCFHTACEKFSVLLPDIRGQDTLSGWITSTQPLTFHGALEIFCTHVQAKWILQSSTGQHEFAGSLDGKTAHRQMQDLHYNEQEKG